MRSEPKLTTRERFIAFLRRLAVKVDPPTPAPPSPSMILAEMVCQDLLRLEYEVEKGSWRDKSGRLEGDLDPKKSHSLVKVDKITTEKYVIEHIGGRWVYPSGRMHDYDDTDYSYRASACGYVFDRHSDEVKLIIETLSKCAKMKQDRIDAQKAADRELAAVNAIAQWCTPMLENNNADSHPDHVHDAEDSSRVRRPEDRTSRLLDPCDD